MSAHHRGMMKLALAVMFTAIAAVPASPQSPPPTGRRLTLASEMIRGYTMLQRDLLDAAELMPKRTICSSRHPRRVRSASSFRTWR